MSKDNILYRGDVAEHFLDSDGELSGLLLKNAQRFQYEKLKGDRKNGINVNKDSEAYWKPVAGGGNFYLPNGNIASLNMRYELPETAFEQTLAQGSARCAEPPESRRRDQSERTTPPPRPPLNRQAGRNVVAQQVHSRNCLRIVSAHMSAVSGGMSIPKLSRSLGSERVSKASISST
jgi:hypothetical protein